MITVANVWWGSHLLCGLLEVGAVSPLGQDNGLHVFPVQAAGFGNVSWKLGWGDVVLCVCVCMWGEGEWGEGDGGFRNRLHSEWMTGQNSNNFYLWQLPFWPGAVGTVVIRSTLLINVFQPLWDRHTHTEKNWIFVKGAVTSLCLQGVLTEHVKKINHLKNPL